MPEEAREHDETGVQESNPNATGPHRLTGGMGVSSERTGPDGPDPADTGVQGTGTHGSAAHTTDGLSNTSREAVIEETDETGEQDPMAHAEHVAEWREQRHAKRRSAEDDDGRFGTGIDRTVGESNTAEVPPQPFDRTKNPGHSHGS